jgi:hypothetical protein
MLSNTSPSWARISPLTDQETGGKHESRQIDSLLGPDLSFLSLPVSVRDRSSSMYFSPTIAFSLPGTRGRVRTAYVTGLHGE